MLAALSLSHRKHRRLLVSSDLFELVDRAREAEDALSLGAGVLGGGGAGGGGGEGGVPRTLRLTAEEKKTVAYLDRLEAATPEAVGVQQVSRRHLQSESNESLEGTRVED